VTLAEAFSDHSFAGADLVIRQGGPSIGQIGLLSKAMRLFASVDPFRPAISCVWHPLGLVVKATEYEESVSLAEMDTYLHFYVGGV
jgi:hypothetical protein